MHSTPATIVHDLLADRGPMDSDALLKAARHDGAHLNADELDEMLHDDEQIPLVVCLPARRHGLGDQILTGRTFTHRITDTERALDVLVADPDLLVLGPLMEAGSEVLKRPVGDMVRSARGALADQRSVAGVASGGGRDLEDAPEVRAMLEDFVRDYEKKWLDTSIPALGGKTPRQAVGDPTRRNDLIRLVDSFDDLADGPGSMRTDRLREALGL